MNFGMALAAEQWAQPLLGGNFLLHSHSGTVAQWHAALFCVLYLRARTLWAPIALHADIVVFVMRVYQKTMHIFPHELRWLFAGGGLADGLLPSILTLALTFILTLRLPVSRT